MINKQKTVKICDSLIEAGWLVIIFLIPVLFSFFRINYNLFQLPRAVIFCILTELMLLIYILKIFLENKISFKINNKLLILFSALIISYFLSLYFSINPLKSWQGSFTRQEGVYIFLHYVLFFLLLVLNLKNWRQIRRIIIAVLLSSAIVCAYGLLQYVDLDFIDWKKSAIVQGRIFSSLGQPNFLAHWLIMVIPLAFYSYFYVFKKNLSRFFILVLAIAQILCLILTYSRAAWLGFAAEIFLLIFIFLLLNFRPALAHISPRRSLSAEDCGGLSAFSPQSLARRLRRGGRKASYKFLALLIFLFFLVSAAGIASSSAQLADNKLTKRAKSFLDLKHSSGYTRLLYWHGAFEEIKQLPAKRFLFGYGQENISDVYVKHYKPIWGIYETINTYPDRSHNAILDIILTSGFLGLFIILLFYYFIISLAIKYIKHEKDSKKRWLAITALIILSGYFVNNLFSFSVIASHVYFYLILALLVFLISKHEKERIIKFVFLRNSSKILIYSAFALAISASIWLYGIKPAVADYYFMGVDKEKEIRGGHCLGILDNLNKTIKWAPSQPFYQDKYVYNSLNCMVGDNANEVNLKIKNNIEEVISLANQEKLGYKFKVNIAHAYSLFGYYFDSDYYKIADAKYSELLKINPYFTTIYKDWSRMKMWQGNYDEAIAIFSQGLKIVPDFNKSFTIEHTENIKKELIIFYDNLGQAYFYKKDFGRALYYYQKILKLDPYQAEIYKKIANIYYRQGDLDRAVWYNKRIDMLNSK